MEKGAETSRIRWKAEKGEREVESSGTTQNQAEVGITCVNGIERNSTAYFGEIQRDLRGLLRGKVDVLHAEYDKI
jgi:hypothetical protein